MLSSGYRKAYIYEIVWPVYIYTEMLQNFNRYQLNLLILCYILIVIKKRKKISFYWILIVSPLLHDIGFASDH